MNTARGYVKNLYRKLGVHNQLELLAVARERGLLDRGRVSGAVAIVRPTEAGDLFPYPGPGRGAMMRSMSRPTEPCQRGEQTCW